MNYPTTDIGRRLVSEFEALLPRVITEEGFWPLPMMIAIGGEILKPVRSQTIGLETSDSKAFEAFLKYCAHPQVIGAIFGLDRYSDQEDMKTELNDVLTVTLYEAANRLEVEYIAPRERFRYGIIEYCYKPRVIRKINWNHPKWINQMDLELSAHVPDVRYPVDRDGTTPVEILMPKMGGIHGI